MAFSSSFVSSFEFLWSSYKKMLNIKWLHLSKSKFNDLAGFLHYRWLLLPILSSTELIIYLYKLQLSLQARYYLLHLFDFCFRLNLPRISMKNWKKLKFSTFCWNSSSFLQVTKATLSRFSYLVLWHMGPRSHLLSASCWLLDHELQLLH